MKQMISLLSHLTPEQREIQQAARDFAHAEIAPYTAQWDRDAYFEPSLVQKLGELGFLGSWCGHADDSGSTRHGSRRSRGDAAVDASFSVWSACTTRYQRRDPALGEHEQNSGICARSPRL